MFGGNALASFSIFKRARGEKEQIDIQEAFNIFNLLRARYLSSQTVKIFKNFVHDREWGIILDRFLKHFEQQITVLEAEGKKFRISVPNKPPLDIKFAASINEITDEYIYKKIYHDLIAQLMSLIHAVRTTSDKYLKYGKMKGWTRVVPIYGEPVL